MTPRMLLHQLEVTPMTPHAGTPQPLFQVAAGTQVTVTAQVTEAKRLPMSGRYVYELVDRHGATGIVRAVGAVGHARRGQTVQVIGHVKGSRPPWPVLIDAIVLRVVT